MRVIGVDFSGAEPEVGKTWIVEGALNGNVLTLQSCHHIIRADLTRKLADLEKPAVVAMDFPFSVPRGFADFWCPSRVAQEGLMPDVWATAARLKLRDFRTRRDTFVASRHWEPKRACDPLESFSCLHDTRPDMVPMTFWGMRMLNRLWQGTTASPVLVPPLLQPNRPDEKEPITLLEVMPGATLRSLDLPYKGYKNGQRTDQRRQKILNELPVRARPVEVNLRVDTDRPCHRGLCQVIRNNANRTNLYDICRYHDDALDAVVAAIAAALWAIPETREHFIRPPEPIAPTVRLEGWLYTPGGCYLHNCVERI